MLCFYKFINVYNYEIGANFIVEYYLVLTAK